MKTSRASLFSLILLTSLLNPPTARAEATADSLNRALDLVHQVENPTTPPPSNARQIDLLTQAIAAAQAAPNHRLKGHRVLAIQALRSALTEIKIGDPEHKAAIDLHTADTELSTSISLASMADTQSNLTPPSSSGSSQTTTPPTIRPAQATANDQQPAINAAQIPPPGVTPQMEADFLAKYKAALEKKDPEAYMTLVATDPAMDAKTKEDIRGLELLSLALTLSNPNRIYAFVPLTPGEQDKPEEFAGKMYDDYLPAVIGLKITFGKPDSSKANPDSDQPVASGDTTLRLCVNNHQLMLAGPKEIPGATPPPAKPRDNFGLKPNLRKLDGEKEISDTFTSLDDFLSSLKQPDVEVLASGETDLVYYAVCCVKPNLCVYADHNRPGAGNYSSYIQAADAHQQELKDSPTWIHLVDVAVDNGPAPLVQGTVFEVPKQYSGSVTIKAQYSDDKTNKSSSFAKTIAWK